MDITNFFRLFIDFSVALFSQFIRIRFSLFGYTIDLWAFIIMFLVLAGLISVFWRGAKR